MREINRRVFDTTIIAETWKRQYFHEGHWGNAFGASAEEIYRKLLTTTNPDEVDAIVGNAGWT